MRLLRGREVPSALRCQGRIRLIQGQRIKGVGLSLNMFLKNNQMDMFLIVLKDFLKKVPLEDQELSNDLSNIFKKISFLISFYDKLEKTIQKLEYNR